MASLSAIRHGRLGPELVTRLRDKGKAGNVVAIAVARKIPTIANAALRDRARFGTSK